MSPSAIAAGLLILVLGVAGYLAWLSEVEGKEIQMRHCACGKRAIPDCTGPGADVLCLRCGKRVK